MNRITGIILIFWIWFIPCHTSQAGELLLDLGPEELVQVGAPPVDIDINGYSVPSYVDWDNDERKDLVIGEGGDGFTGKVRVYLNTGTSGEPTFTEYFYAQSNGVDLTCTASGCLGCFPRVVYWDGDNRKDLLIGLASGVVRLFLNVGTDTNPTFDGGTYLKVGPAGFKLNIIVGARAAVTVVDWNSDGRKDLVIGALDGKIHLFINEGTDTTPDFITETYAQLNGADLIVPTGRSSPIVKDLDGDGKKDLLCGNTNGQLFFYRNVGSDTAPSFSEYIPVEADGIPIDLSGARSRPSICDWTNDGYLDILIGTSDGKVHIFQSKSVLGDVNRDFNVDLSEFVYVSQFWLIGTCDSVNLLCQRADIGQNGQVGIDDLEILIGNWLPGF